VPPLVPDEIGHKKAIRKAPSAVHLLELIYVPSGKDDLDRLSWDDALEQLLKEAGEDT